jgi:hypothetical protein
MEGKVGMRLRRWEMRERWRWWYVRRGSGGELGKVFREVSGGIVRMVIRRAFREIVDKQEPDKVHC